VSKLRPAEVFLFDGKHVPGFLEHALSGAGRCSSILKPHGSHRNTFNFISGTKSDSHTFSRIGKICIGVES
jgi:hypothetical protein